MASSKEAKKQALILLIKHVNKSRFKDKTIDPKKEMVAAMKAEKPDEDMEEERDTASEEPTADKEALRSFLRDSGKTKTGKGSIPMVSSKTAPASFKKKAKRRG